MTITQFTAARAAATSCHSSADFLGRFPDIAPCELKDVWAIHDDYNIAAVRTLSGLTQAEFAARYGIALRTVENWTRDGEGHRNIQPYLLDLLAVDVINMRAAGNNKGGLKTRDVTLYEVRIDKFSDGKGIEERQIFYLDFGTAVECAEKEKEKAGNNTIVEMKRHDLQVSDDYEMRSPQRLAYDKRLTMQEPGLDE